MKAQKTEEAPNRSPKARNKRERSGRPRQALEAPNRFPRKGETAPCAIAAFTGPSELLSLSRCLCDLAKTLTLSRCLWRAPAD